MNRRRLAGWAGGVLAAGLVLGAWLRLGPIDPALLQQQQSLTVLDRNGEVLYESLGSSGTRAESVAADNVEFRLGEIEHLPIADNTADVVISNCVINLVPDKHQAFREAFRVL